MMPGNFDAAQGSMCFDEEFGQDPAAILRGQRRKARLRLLTLVGVALGAGVIGALAFTAGERLRLELQSAVVAPISPPTRESLDEEIDRLRRQVEALKNEITELKDAREQAAHAVPALTAEQDLRDSPRSAYWYSNPAALRFGIESRLERGSDVVPLPRRAPTPRPAVE
jgi:hypothetical protein